MKNAPLVVFINFFILFINNVVDMTVIICKQFKSYLTQIYSVCTMYSIRLLNKVFKFFDSLEVNRGQPDNSVKKCLLKTYVLFEAHTWYIDPPCRVQDPHCICWGSEVI